MEVHAGRLIWLRSIRTNKMRYVTVLSDGDTKLHSELNRLQPYGPDTVIEKEECVNHVSKRLFTGLKNAVASARAAKVTLGGNGAGRLTESKIKLFQKWYARAIKRHQTAEEMQNAILATPYHCFSTDENPQHNRCPSGPDSWCFFKKAEHFERQPEPHHLMIGHPLDEKLTCKWIMPVFQRLSSLELLCRCES